MKTLAALALAAVLGAAAPALAETPDQAEAVLRGTITAIQSGAPNYDQMVTPLADAVKANASGQAQLAALGPVTAVVATSTADPFSYDVTFQAGVTLHWTLSFDDAGKIDGLEVH